MATAESAIFNPTIIAKTVMITQKSQIYPSYSWYSADIEAGPKCNFLIKQKVTG